MDWNPHPRCILLYSCPIFPRQVLDSLHEWMKNSLEWYKIRFLHLAASQKIVICTNVPTLLLTPVYQILWVYRLKMPPASCPYLGKNVTAFQNYSILIGFHMNINIWMRPLLLFLVSVVITLCIDKNKLCLSPEHGFVTLYKMNL